MQEHELQIQTARLLGYRIVTGYEGNYKWVITPEGEQMVDTIQSRNVHLDLSHWAVLDDLYTRYGIKYGIRLEKPLMGG